MQTRFTTKSKTGLMLGSVTLQCCMLFGVYPAVAQYESAHSYCDRYARDYAERNASGGSLRGAGRGAAGGAIFGAIGGDVGRGAGIGAAFGALGGSIRKSESKDSLYRQAYDDCMRRNR